ncbi:AMIN-like domain-containing (lipo)protein [Pseudonocardia nigra]|uniref:AMIN-like domain-containing (lipo)protein n=1 Tax=Pseudonocardia nigra TaxID=1921578 RepID=UPI001C5FA5B5|nr:hypothetical protein [Pseudonocardia nigra]
MSRTIRVLLVALLALAGAAVAVPASAATACATPWGSLPESASLLGRGAVVDVRSGRHACFDRLVFEVRGPAAGYSVQYVGQVTQDGSGAVVPVPGGARLQVVLHHPAYDDRGNSTLPGARPGRSLEDVRGYSTLRSVIYAGSFEGQTTIGVGTRARLPFRVFTLDGPGDRDRIVLDVAHRWS